MKRILSFALVLSLVFSLASCGAASDNSSAPVQSATASEAASAGQAATAVRPTQGNGKIGFSTITLGSEFFSSMDAAVHNRLEAGGYEVITISCEANAAQQVSDIENLITMNCEAIFFFAVDPNALTDVLKKGRKAGIKMYGIACTIDDLEAYDKIINTDQYASGVGAAEMAASWVDATFPDAADGSIETALIVNTSTVDSNKRSDGERTVAELSPKIKVVAEYDLAGASDSNIKAQEYAEIMQSQYPNLKCVVTYGTDASLGINEAFMRNAGLNRSEFAVFGVDTNEVIYKGIKSSITDESLIRGTVSLGDDLSIDVWECLIDADLEYMDESRSIFKPVKLITTENIGNYVS